MWSIFDRIQDIDGLSSSEDPEVTRRKRVGFRKEIIALLMLKMTIFSKKLNWQKLMFIFKREVDIEVRIVIEV